MAGAYAYTPAIWPPLIGAIFLAAIGLYSWRHRDVPAALALVAGCLFAMLWLLGMALEAAAVAQATKIAWYKFQALWRLPAVTADTCFVLEYVYPGRWLTRRNLSLLALGPLLEMLLVVTNAGRMLWRSLEVGSQGTVVAYLAPPGAILLAYPFALLLVNVAVLVWLFIHSPQHRWPVALMLFAQMAARGVYALNYAYLPLPTWFDPDIITVLLVWGTYAIVLFGFLIFDPVPAARVAALEQMRDGMVVFDPQWRVASLNPAAASILGASAAGARGKRADEALAAFGDLREHLGTGRAESFESSLGSADSARSYEADVSSLHDFRGLLVGYLLLLRDVTEHRRAEAQIIEQQQSLAMLREREYLARELHDGIGQVMGYAGLQLEVVQDCITDGQGAVSAGQGAEASAYLAEAGRQITRLSTVVEEAHADLREYILNLRLSPSEQQPFLAALRHYLHGYSQNYGIQTQLSVGSGIEAEKLDPDAQMQLFRIIQEALSNARKHAGASRVQVSFETQDCRMRVQIQDNGRGFDPALAANDRDSHFGLGIMRERAEQIDGSLRVQSQLGAGTCVLVDLPLERCAGEERR